MYCLNSSDGVGCMKCEWACIKHKKLSEVARPYFDSNEDYQCLICNYQCSVVYFRHEEKKLTVQTKDEYLASIDTKQQKKIDGSHLLVVYGLHPTQSATRS